MAKTPLQAAEHEHHDHEHHIVPTGTYVIVLLLLTVLMATTVAVYYVDVPEVGPISGTIMNQSIALIIAVAKAALVVFFFMGVRWGTKLTKMWAATGFVWFFLLFLIFIDYPMRAFESINGWEGQPGKAGHSQDGSALPRVVVPSGQPQPVAPNEVNLRPRG